MLTEASLPVKQIKNYKKTEILQLTEKSRQQQNPSIKLHQNYTPLMPLTHLDSSTKLIPESLDQEILITLEGAIHTEVLSGKRKKQ